MNAEVIPFAIVWSLPLGMPAFAQDIAVDEQDVSPEDAIPGRQP